jgi:hypothetical protein
MRTYAPGREGQAGELILPRLRRGGDREAVEGAGEEAMALCPPAPLFMVFHHINGDLVGADEDPSPASIRGLAASANCVRSSV